MPYCISYYKTQTCVHKLLCTYVHIGFTQAIGEERNLPVSEKYLVQNANNRCYQH